MFTFARSHILLLLGAAATAACTDTRLNTPGAAPDPPIAVVGRSAADHRFLRWIRDHHAGLAEVVHAAEARGGGAERRAEQIDFSYDVELDQARTLLRIQFADTMPSLPMDDARAWMDSIQTLPRELTIGALDRLAIAHHREVIETTVAYLNEGTNPAVRQLAEQIQARKTRELQDLQRSTPP